MDVYQLAVYYKISSFWLLLFAGTSLEADEN